jgi:hypothetical protein
MPSTLEAARKLFPLPDIPSGKDADRGWENLARKVAEFADSRAAEELEAILLEVKDKFCGTGHVYQVIEKCISELRKGEIVP